jgi:hypothetical protein
VEGKSGRVRLITDEMWYRRKREIKQDSRVSAPMKYSCSLGPAALVWPKGDRYIASSLGISHWLEGHEWQRNERNK